MSPSQKTRDALPARVAAGLKKLGAPAANAGNVRTHADLDAIPWKDVDLVVEAATEDLPLKHRLFAELERLARPEIPLASNTSTFPIGEIGKPLKTRSRVAGLHFFMPAHLVPLVEVISAEFTDPKIAEHLMELMNDARQGADLGQRRTCPASSATGCSTPLLREALYLVAERRHDTGGHRYRRALWLRLPLRRLRADAPEGDVRAGTRSLLAATSIYPHLYNDNGPPPLLKEMVGKGHIGMKSKHGFWEWTDESVAQEKARIERCLQAGMEILNSDADSVKRQGAGVRREEAGDFPGIAHLPFPLSSRLTSIT